MKRLLNLVYSNKATLWLLLVFAISMAVATFVEDRYDTPTAYKNIYGAKWFELVILLLGINFIGNIKRYNLMSKKKLSGFLFHIAFIVMIIGAGVTRYFGFEGLIHIREGESSNTLVSPTHVIKVKAIGTDGVQIANIPFELKDTPDVKFKETISVSGGNELKVQYKKSYANAIYSFVENSEGGTDYLKFNVVSNGQESDIYVANNGVAENGVVRLTFNSPIDTSAFQFQEKEGKIFMITPVELKTVTLPMMTFGLVNAGSMVEITPATQYSTNNESFKFICHGILRKAQRQLTYGVPGAQGISAIVVDVEYNEKSFEVPIVLNQNGFADMQNANIEGISLLLGYGEKETKLPFSLKLRDFILDRYPGSANPSSYASEVTVIDPRDNTNLDYRIFMNNILDYDGYRFFQSSYDKDEGGTILSVNHDFWGTTITYIGYLLLGLGFIFNLFSKYSRFQILGRTISELRKMRIKNTVGILLFVLFAFGVNAQETIRKPISLSHAEKLGSLIVQTNDGRSEPLHTLAFDVVHKIAKKDKFNVSGKGEMDAMQLFLDIMLDPNFWKTQAIIYVKEKSVQSALGIQGKYACFNDLTNNNGGFKLADQTDEAFRKKPAEQNPFDKELIKLSERFEIYFMMTQGTLMKLFPEPVANSTVWISWDDPKAQITLQDYNNLMSELQIPILNYNNFMGAYLNAAYTGSNTGDFTRADKIVSLIEGVQRSSAIAELIPSAKQVQYEIYYNKAGIFIMLKNIYGVLAIFLLILAYVENFMEKRNKVVSGLLNFFLVLLGFAFAYHTFGMGLRWYLSGHAPWSNGYEALLLVGWAGILAGFSFIRYSKIPLAATALLAFFTLMTASHSSYDPQITNLQPVLKSYWLIIHVATLTISYGFLGLAFLLGIFILTLFLFRNESNSARFELKIKELSHINEMNITVGLALATIGCFLGGVWANESWGRYWGWDAKETWALIITITYSIVVHLRLVDSMRGDYIFTVGSVLAFASVLMTFIGVNYYLSKGMHSYGAGETPIFPLWGWITILTIFALIIGAGFRNKILREKLGK
jgi:cytochrome c-type biogenesis protein CcsB